MSDAKPNTGTVIASSAPAAAPAGGTVIADAGSSAAMADAAPASTGPLVGQVLAGRYKVEKKLGEGGMGTVYAGRHATINKRVAIKVLSSDFAHKPDLVERFLQEAKAASMVNQENVVEISDFGDTPDGSVFFVMEFLEGEDLSDTVKKNGPMPWQRLKPIMVQICNALQAAHDAGIIHRDMKPENCYRIKRGSNEDFIKVLDFGIAKVTSEEEGGGGKGLTRTGMIFGTPEYMSPEQSRGEKVDNRVDVYAVGVIMYELLTGRVPFTADTFMGVLTKHMFEVPEAPSTVCPTNPIPPEAEAIVLKALQKDKNYRFQSMREMAEAIEAVGTGAAAVAIVSENIVRPQTTGEMAFIGGSTGTTAPPILPGGTVGYEEPRRGGGLVYGIVGAVVLAGAGFGVWIALGSNKPADAPVAQAPVVAGNPDAKQPDATAAQPNVDASKAAAPPTPTPTPTPTPAEVAAGTEGALQQKVIAAEIPTVHIFFDTGGVKAEILDPRDTPPSKYGDTDEPTGIKMEKSVEKVQILLRAEGYEDYPVEFVPDRDNKKIPVDLKKKAKRKTTSSSSKGKGSSGGSSGSSASSTTPPPTPPDDKADSGSRAKPPVTTPDDKKKGGKTVGSPDLKDPFGKR